MCLKVLKFQDNKFKIVQNISSKIIIKNISWKIYWSWWSLHDKCGSQKPNIDGTDLQGNERFTENSNEKFLKAKVIDGLKGK